jgi:hypothetical protein
MLDLMDKVAGVLVNIIKTNNSKCSWPISIQTEDN